MTLLIDGYNLIHSAGFAPRQIGPGGLQRARQALLEFLAATLEKNVLARTIVVFDAQRPAVERNHLYEYQGMMVQFAAGYDDADSLIEELIKKDSAPRQLTVVSSDHRLHRAARKRRARAIDSQDWYAAMLRQRQARQLPSEPPKPQAPAVPTLSPEEIEAWSRQLAEEGKNEGDGPIFPPDYLKKVEDES